MAETSLDNHNQATKEISRFAKSLASTQTWVVHGFANRTSRVPELDIALINST